MKLFKLIVTGNNENFTINYTVSSNFLDYNDCGFTGAQQEKYKMFLVDLQKNGGPQPVNIKVNMTTQIVDRAFSKNDLIKTTDVYDFIKKLSR
ncbi:hypothetical protein LGK95_08715 [Clostridium algoriphilum]|uniref:hypothetical protein n=1 Tax=Clostridium algoriphilum TaxID=198347 RepID=UPI001CF0E0A2|nr:hypothetical protein [Clostridium algoriphilum]MCB2293603.1 hypothetical protein [Clostridium algoriphilum]